MRTVLCPDGCGARVRPCNLARHQRSHMPTPVWRITHTYYGPAKRPLLQFRTHDTRYDELVPRGRGLHRFRIYRLRGGELQLLASAPTGAFFGEALVELKSQGEFIPDDAVGVLDTADDPGGWIVHPFALGRTRSAA